MSRKFDVSPHFKKMLRSKSPESQKRVKAAMKRILEDDRSGGLRLKPMQGWQGIWEARVSKSLRITYEYGDEGRARKYSRANLSRRRQVGVVLAVHTEVHSNWRRRTDGPPAAVTASPFEPRSFECRRFDSCLCLREVQTKEKDPYETGLLVPKDGIEPTTQRFSVACSTD